MSKKTSPSSLRIKQPESEDQELDEFSNPEVALTPTHLLNQKVARATDYLVDSSLKRKIEKLPKNGKEHVQFCFSETYNELGDSDDYTVDVFFIATDNEYAVYLHVMKQVHFGQRPFEKPKEEKILVQKTSPAALSPGVKAPDKTINTKSLQNLQTKDPIKRGGDLKNPRQSAFGEMLIRICTLSDLDRLEELVCYYFGNPRSTAILHDLRGRMERYFKVAPLKTFLCNDSNQLLTNNCRRSDLSKLLLSDNKPDLIDCLLDDDYDQGKVFDEDDDLLCRPLNAQTVCLANDLNLIRIGFQSDGLEAKTSMGKPFLELIAGSYDYNTQAIGRTGRPYNLFEGKNNSKAIIKKCLECIKKLMHDDYSSRQLIFFNDLNEIRASKCSMFLKDFISLKKFKAEKMLKKLLRIPENEFENSSPLFEDVVHIIMQNVKFQNWSVYNSKSFNENTN